MWVNQNSGNYHILASGDTFLFDPWGDLSISIENEEGLQIKVTLRFANDEKKGHRVETAIVEGSLMITCYNFDGLGTGLKRPTHIADVDDKAVYILFSSQYVGSKDQGTRSVRYTIFMEN